jgi:hypothetical protein
VQDTGEKQVPRFARNDNNFWAWNDNGLKLGTTTVLARNEIDLGSVLAAV